MQLYFCTETKKLTTFHLDTSSHRQHRSWVAEWVTAARDVTVSQRSPSHHPQVHSNITLDLCIFYEGHAQDSEKGHSVTSAVVLLILFPLFV